MDKINLIEVVLLMIWLMLPAYLANPAASLSRFFSDSFKPIDFGKSWGNNRILGDGKSFEGFIYGVGFGILIAIIECLLADTLNMPRFAPVAMITLPLGSLSGDLVASFFKRRMNFQRGAAFPLLDQLDFVFGAWLLTYIFSPAWFTEYFTPPIIIATLILTPVLHLLLNVIGYKIGVNKHPW